MASKVRKDGYEEREVTCSGDKCDVTMIVIVKRGRKSFQDAGFRCGVCCAAIMDRSRALEVSLADVNARVKDLEKTVSELKTLKKTVDELKNTPTPPPAQLFSEIVKQGLPQGSVTTVVRQIKQEERYQAQCTNNLVIKGLQVKDDSEENKTADDATMKALTQEIGVSLDGVRFKTKRVGRVSPGNTQLLILTVPKNTKAEIMRNKWELAQTEQWKNVFISPDLTRDQRLAEFTMRQELRRLRAAEPDKEWYINWRLGKVAERKD